MRALYVPAAGESPRLADLPIPLAGEGQVAIHVKAAGLNAIDNAIVGGLLAGAFPHEYPLVVGRDAAGVVVAVGDGVDHVTLGDEVFGHVLLAPPISAGTLAEYAVLPAAAVAAKPPALDFTTAAAIPLSGTAAVAAIAVVSPEAGQSVLVNGASGGVGSFVVQLLAARGVDVVATGTAADVDRLVKLGAATVIDYTSGPVVEQVLAARPGGVDALIELTVRNPDAVPLGAVRSGGKVSSATHVATGEVLAAAGLTGANIMSWPTRDITAPLAEQAAAGTLIVDVQSVLPLEQAAEGLATIAAGAARGKIVVTVD